MFKKLSFSLALSITAIMAKSQITDPSPYCTAEFGAAYNNMFKDITIGGVTLSFGSMGAYGTNSPSYKYYNTVVLGNLTKSGNNTITINPYSLNDVEPIYFALWIDYDHSNTFEDSEIVMQNSNTINAGLPVFGQTASPITKNFTIPAAALTGNTRARLIRRQGNGDYTSTYVMGACSTSVIIMPPPLPPLPDGTMGNAYDFNVNIAESLSTEEIAVKNTFRVSPNPAHDFIKIEALQQVTRAEIFSMEGRLVKEYHSADHMNVSSLQSGGYILKIFFKDGSFASQKILIEK
ncbi:Por secretion system C-terminal sorting domain-containing protein [Chryseobacterium sp. RU37D]|uniref:T9SS type A sorting domain-containing protein n=1 Tax=Chryseobacterium sp. RU37D TaxID=1907397 RepID=UPI000955980D|nr:T9SS type A sorting domain-containing protein [Chryseobacterium sp. RU37D]SIQ87625.1 Por secretion system C-terminal sorting domain-containing protein [Chryseobacterium sp. RU37D]